MHVDELIRRMNARINTIEQEYFDVYEKLGRIYCSHRSDPACYAVSTAVEEVLSRRREQERLKELILRIQEQVTKLS